MKQELLGKKVACMVETEYIPFELKFYEDFFTGLGATVDFMTYLWGKSERTIVCDVTEPDGKLESMVITKEIADADADDYDIVLIAANYVGCRLREIPPMGYIGSVAEVAKPPAVQFMAKAMANNKTVKGALCHGLWILTPRPDLLEGRKVICHTVVLADVINAGAIFVPNTSNNIVVDGDLVTARSAGDIQGYCEALLKTCLNIG